MAISLAVLILPMMTSSRSDVPDLDELAGNSPFVFGNPAENPRFIERMRGVIESAIEYGWI